MPKLLTQGVSLEPKNGRQLIGIVAGFKSERWPVIDRNAGRLQLGIRSYPVSEVSQRLGVSQHSLYEWKKKFAASNARGNDEAEEIRRLKKELARVTEERDILKKAAAYFAKDAK